MRELVAALGLLLATASAVAGRDYFVNNVAGDDRKDGLAEVTTSPDSGPVKTIAKALRLAGKMDRVIVANTGEPYRESITISGRHSGRPGLPFTIIGNGAVLDGRTPVPEIAWEFFHGELFRFEPRRKPQQILFLEGKPLPRGPQPTVPGSLPPLAPMEWRYHEGFVYFRPEPGRLPLQYDLEHTGLRVGITLYQVMHVDIQDLVVQGYQLDGVNAHDSAFSVRLVGLTCRGNGRSGITVAGSSQALLEACLAGDNGESQLRTEGWSHTRLVNSVLLDDSAPAIVQEDESQIEEINVEPDAA